jgi:DNA primase
VDRIQWIKQNVDPISEATSLLGPPQRMRSGRLLWVCPVHDDHKPSLQGDTVPPWEGRFKCYPCDFNGDIIDLLMFVKGISKREAIDQLAPPERFPRREFEPGVEMRRFLQGRAWEPEVAKELGLSVVSDKFDRPRIRFPFRRRGTVVYWQDRACSDEQSPKWLSATGPTPCPYEIDRIANAHSNWLLLVEGLPDVVALAHAFPACAVVGIPGGSAFKPEWASLFKGLRVCVVADNDDAGINLRARLDGSLGIAVTHAFIPECFNDLDQWRQKDPEKFPMWVGEWLNGYT